MLIDQQQLRQNYAQQNEKKSKLSKGHGGHLGVQINLKDKNIWLEPYQTIRL